jgi:hypothetical protein
MRDRSVNHIRTRMPDPTSASAIRMQLPTADIAVLCLSHGVYKLVAALRIAGGVLVRVMHLLKWSHGFMHGHGQGEEGWGLHLHAPQHLRCARS